MEFDKKSELESIDSAIETLDRASCVLDGFIGEREIRECINPYLVGRATAADVLINECIKELKDIRHMFYEK